MPRTKTAPRTSLPPDADAPPDPSVKHVGEVLDEMAGIPTVAELDWKREDAELIVERLAAARAEETRLREEEDVARHEYNEAANRRKVATALVQGLLDGLTDSQPKVWETRHRESANGNGQAHAEPVRRCRVCGCTEADCRQCVEKTGEPCYWVEEDMCSACANLPSWDHACQWNITLPDGRVLETTWEPLVRSLIFAVAGPAPGLRYYATEVPQDHIGGSLDAYAESVATAEFMPKKEAPAPKRGRPKKGAT